MTDDYPIYTFNEDYYRSGTAFWWEWTAANRPQFSPGQTRQLAFQFTPAEIPSFDFSWVDTGSDDIGLVALGDRFDVWKVTATATDAATGKQTVTTAYATAAGVAPPFSLSIITWESRVQ
jgi:hypothetical protein